MRDRARQRSPDIRRSVRRPGRWWLLGALLVVGGCASDSVKAGPANETTPEVVDAPVTEVARFSAPSATALAVRPDGTLLVGERLTGRIFSADPDSATTSNLATVKDLDTGMTQGGLLGLALTSEGGILVSYTSSDGHIVIDQTDASARNFTRRWDGPKTAERANGGRLAVLGGDTHDQNTLIIGIGDLLDPAKTLGRTRPTASCFASTRKVVPVRGLRASTTRLRLEATKPTPSGSPTTHRASSPSACSGSPPPAPRWWLRGSTPACLRVWR